MRPSPLSTLAALVCAALGAPAVMLACNSPEKPNETSPASQPSSAPPVALNATPAAAAAPVALVASSPQGAPRPGVPGLFPSVPLGAFDGGTGLALPPFPSAFALPSAFPAAFPSVALPPGIPSALPQGIPTALPGPWPSALPSAWPAPPR